MGEDGPEPDEPPTMPPPPAPRQAGLRWATPPAVRRPRIVPAVPSPGFPPTRPLPQVETPPPGRHRKLPFMLGLVLAAAVVAAGLVLALGTAPSGQSPRRGVTHLAPPLVFEDLLHSLSGAGALAGRAVAQACQETGPQSGARQVLVSDLGRAAAEDRTVLSTLSASRARLVIWSDGAGAKLFGSMETLAGASLIAAGDYKAWLLDLQSTGCYSAPENNLHYERASGASLAEERAAEHLAAVWAPVARRYHLNPMKLTESDTLSVWPNR